MKQVTRTKWTEEELQILRENYATVTLARELLPLLPNRTVNQITCTATYLGLKRTGGVGEQFPLLLKDTDAAYLAGIIDGEGTIAVNRFYTRSRKRGIQLKSWIAVYNTNTTLLDWVASTTGMGGISRQRKNPTINSKMVYEWKITAIRDVAQLLRAITPYLIMKRKQAELTIEFCENRVLYHPATERELEIIEELRTLNHRGAAD